MGTPAIDAAEGTLLGQRFRLVDAIGEGAMGSVWRAVDETSGHLVAVKILHVHMASDRGLAARFEREIAAGRKVSHPNVLPVIADGDAPCGRFMVMPLLGGHDLRRVLGEAIGVRRTVSVARQLFAALDHVHGLGFVHRDIKPENLRLLDDGEHGERLVLFDFGLVRAAGEVDRERALTQQGRVFGTPWYMAPEQAMGAKVDHRVDLYAVGGVMYEMLTGAPPFDGTLVGVLHHQINTEAPRLPSWVPAEIADLVARLLAKDPAARPQTAALALRELDDALAGIAARPTIAPSIADEPAFCLGDAPSTIGSGDRPTPILRRSPIAATVATFAVATAAALALWFVVDRGHDVAVSHDAPAIASSAVSSAVTSDTAPTPVAPTSVVPTTREPTTVVVTPPLVVPTAPPVVLASVDPPKVEPIAPARPKRGAGAGRPKPPRSLPPPPSRDPGRKLEPRKPPRTTSKIPGVSAQPAERNPDGSLRIRPSST